MNEDKASEGFEKHEHFDQVSRGYQNALAGMLAGQREMDEAKDLMEATGVQVELQTIGEAGGDIKRVGSTEADRKRAYEAAKEISTRYKAARDHYYSARNDYRYHQGMVRLFDLRLQFLVGLLKGK